MDSTASTQKQTRLIDYLKAIGPGIIVSAVVVGPGSITTTSSMGASFGYTGLWLIVFACIAGYFYQESAIRIVVYKQESVITAIRDNMSPTLAKIVFLLAYVMTLFAQAGNFMGAGMALNYFIPQLSIAAWAAVMIAVVLFLVFMRMESKFELLVKCLIFILAVSFIITAFAAKPDMAEVVREGFKFKIPGGQWMLALALLGTTIVADTPLSLSTLNRDKYCSPSSSMYMLSNIEKTRFAKVDPIVGLCVSGLITASVLVCSGAALHPLGITVNTAADMAVQLTPLLGNFAGVLFSIGLWAAALSPGSYRIKLMPLYFVDAWNIKEGASTVAKRIIQVMAGLVPLAILLIFNGNPVQLIIIAQTAVGLLLPIITIILGVLLNKKSYLGEQVNTLPQNIAYFIMAAVTTALAVRMFINILM